MFLQISILRHSSHLPTKNCSSLHFGLVDGKHLMPVEIISEIHPWKIIVQPPTQQMNFRGPSANITGFPKVANLKPFRVPPNDSL